MRIFMSNKIAVITGASRGIGAAIARKFAKEGMSLTITGFHDREALQKLQEEIENNFSVACRSYVCLRGKNVCPNTGAGYPYKQCRHLLFWPVVRYEYCRLAHGIKYQFECRLLYQQTCHPPYGA